MGATRTTAYCMGLAAALAATGCTGESTTELAIDAEEMADAGVAGERRTRRQNVAISDCGEALLDQYAGTPYLPLVRWRGLAPNDHRDRLTTDPQWYGCEGDERPDSYGLGIDFEFVEVVGLVFSPDAPPPSGTVRLHGVTSGPLSEPENTDKEDAVLFVGPAWELPLGWGYEYSDDRLLEGYVYPANWRPSSDDPVLPLYVMAKERPSTPEDRDFFNDVGTVTVGSSGDLIPTEPAFPSSWDPWMEGSDPLPSSLIGWVIDADAVTPLPIGRCQLDDDCLSQQRCFLNDFEPDELGRCVPRCDTPADCSEEFPYCNLAYNVCTQQLLSNSTLPFDPAVAQPDVEIPEGLVLRETTASYMTGKHQIAWAAPNEARMEDRGDGYGAHLLLEGFATNILSQVNDVWDDGWDTGAMCVYQAQATPGTHDTSLVQVVGDTIACNGVVDPAGTDPFALLSSDSFYSGPAVTYPTRLAFSLWSKASTTASGPVYVDEVDVAGTDPNIQHVSLPTEEWSRVEVASFDATAVPDSVMVGMDANATEGSGRLVSHMQLESTGYPTSAIEPTASGTTAERGSDIAVFIGEPELRDASNEAFAAISYIWPYFSCDDVRALPSARPEIRVLYVAEFDASGLDVEDSLRVSFGVDDMDSCQVIVRTDDPADPTELEIPIDDWDRHQMLAMIFDNTATGNDIDIKVLGAGDPASVTLTGESLPRGPLYTLLDAEGVPALPDVSPFNGRLTPLLPMPDATIQATPEPAKILDLNVRYTVDTSGTATAELTFNTNNFNEVWIDDGSGEISCGAGSKHVCEIEDLVVGASVMFELLDAESSGQVLDSGTLLPLVSCGDGILDNAEECDDGNTDNGDSCADDCTLSVP